VALSEPECVEDVEATHAVLRERRVSLSEAWPFGPEATTSPTDGEDDPFALRLPTLLVANKADRLTDPAAELQAFLELTSLRYPALAVSAVTGAGLGEIGPWLFDHLGIVRVYTKAPGRSPDRVHPFALRRGQTIEDVARLVHKDLARTLRHARVWGAAGFEGQLVGREHPVADGDVVELHT
jgi:ribosome-interacting GTPase 1